MATVEQLLRNYITALSDPTRGAILMELAHVGELTPTQLARRLGMTANNVYHHMRVLRELGVVDPPRAVPRDTYVEKYYRITPEIVAAIDADPNWLDKTQPAMTIADRKALFRGMLLSMAQLLSRAARRFEAMDDETFERDYFAPQTIMASVNTMDHDKLMRRLTSLRDMLADEWRADAGTPPPTTPSPTNNNLVLMAALPRLWDDEPPSGQ